MAWLARVGDLLAGRKGRIGFANSDPAGWDVLETGEEEETLSGFASPHLDIDLTAAPPPPDFLSSSLDLMQGLTVTELPFDAVPAEQRSELRRAGASQSSYLNDKDTFAR